MEKCWPTKTPDLEWCPDEFTPGKADSLGRVHHKGSLTRRTVARTAKSKFEHARSFYADDGAFIFLSYEDLVKGTEYIFKQFKRFGLEMHVGKRTISPGGQDEDSKTEAMFFPPCSQRKNVTPTNLLTGTFDVGNDGRFYVKFCSSFRYLGTYITPDLNDTFDIDARITAASKAWGALKPVLEDKHINRGIRTKLYGATVVSILLWGCESWALKDSDMQKLKVFHMKKARKLCNINMKLVQKHHIPNESILDRLHLMPLDKLLTIRQLRFLQKIACQPQSRLMRKILNSQAIPPTGVKCVNRHATTRKSYRDALIRAKLVDKSSNGELDEWIPKLRRKDTIAKIIEANLDLYENSFNPGRKKKAHPADS
jgi:hypothetical protein